tara:strand:+ start:494 stop:649 length:156 start_codon:yes stop_codon:yes gene_type:complete
LGAEVLGQDVLDLALLWQRSYDVCGGIYDRRGLAIHALSGFDYFPKDGVLK